MATFFVVTIGEGGKLTITDQTILGEHETPPKGIKLSDFPIGKMKEVRAANRRIA